MACSFQRHSQLYVSENGVQRLGHTTGFDGLDQETGVPKTPSGLDPKEAMELVVEGFPSPFKLILERSEGPEFPLGFNKRFDFVRPDRTNQLVLKVSDADVKPQPRHVGRGLWIADSSPG